MERRLAAIMAVDMVGYSRLMAADETGTITRQKRLREALIDPTISRHDGRLVKATGDGFLVEFASVLQAVQCAVEIQKAVAEQEAEGSDQNRIQYRIGINLGDIVVDAGDIFGDGVNIAARLEALADAGGVCISDLVYQNVKSKLDLKFESLGMKALKNIPGEIHVYRIRPDQPPGPLSQAASKDKPALPHKPSIAVLPFANMSSSREHEFFADGITEDIITALSRIRELFIIARNSSFIYKGRNVRIEDVARELGVAFVLEGSVRVAGNRVRVTAQLIEGASGGHVWAENFDGNLDDIFAVQDEITRNIALAMQVKLTYGELARLWEGQTKSLRAWEKMAQGRDLFLKFNPIDNREARRFFKDALAIDPNYTGATTQLGLSYWWDARFSPAADKEQSLRLAEQQVEKALAIDPEMGSAWMLRGGVAFLRDRHDEAVEFCRKAVDLAPSDSWATAFLALVCNYAGQHDSAAAAATTAMRLSPFYPTWYLYHFGLANLWLGNFASAHEAFDEDRRREGDIQGPLSYVYRACLAAFQGHEADTAHEIAMLRRRYPGFVLNEVVLSERYKERKKLDRVVEVLRRAGLPA